MKRNLLLAGIAALACLMNTAHAVECGPSQNPGWDCNTIGSMCAPRCMEESCGSAFPEQERGTLL